MRAAVGMLLKQKNYVVSGEYVYIHIQIYILKQPFGAIVNRAVKSFVDRIFCCCKTKVNLQSIKC